jgi:alkyl hydroperoxide reductase subunit AhpC
MPTPVEQGGPAVTIDDASQLIGRRIEDGVEWAIAHDVTWRVLSYDGVPVADDGPLDTTRISFVVDSDRIVRFEWS